jgi:hypothetical protein
MTHLTEKEKKELRKGVLEIIRQSRSKGVTVDMIWRTLGDVTIYRNYLYNIIYELDRQGLIENMKAGQETRFFIKGMAPEICLTAIQKKVLAIVRRGAPTGLSRTDIEARDKSVVGNLMGTLRVLEEKHLICSEIVERTSGKRRIFYPQTKDLKVRIEPSEEGPEKDMFLTDEEVEILEARGSTAKEISVELKKAGGRVESLIYSILFKYKVETLQKAREKREKERSSVPSEEVVIESR